MAATSLKCCFLPACLICSLLLGFNLQQTQGVPCYNGVAMAGYWIPIEGEEDILASGAPITLGGPKTRRLVDVNGALIATVAELTFLKCKEESMCLVNGDEFLVRYVGGDNVFTVLNRDVYPAGVGGWNNRLEAFVSVATADFAPGTKLFVKELYGKLLDGNSFPATYHNGCVRVDDKASGGCSLQLFTGYYKNFRTAAPRLPRQVHVEPRSTCQIMDYSPLILGLIE